MSNKKHNQIVKDKMRVLSDFGICDIHDEDMKAKLHAEIEKKPNEDPRVVLDVYCRPMIQNVVNSWI